MHHEIVTQRWSHLFSFLVESEFGVPDKKIVPNSKIFIFFSTFLFVTEDEYLGHSESEDFKQFCVINWRQNGDKHRQKTVEIQVQNQIVQVIL